jgi:type II secretory pathway component PulF
MPMLLTPRAMIRHAELYDQWATLVASGVPILRTLANLRRNRFARPYRRMLARVTERVEQGASLPDALQPEAGAIPHLDCAMLRAGDTSGRLDSALKLLAGHYRQRAAWLNQTFSGCAYPVLVLAVALTVFPVDHLVVIFTEGDWTPFLAHKARVFGGIGVAVLVVTAAAAGSRRQWMKGILERIGACIPVLGSALREQALARLAMALDGLLNAGLGVVQAWPEAADASGSPRLRAEVERWRPHMEQGFPVSEALASSRLIPDLFADAYQVGEFSGKLDESLHRLYTHYSESAARKIERLSFWLPRLLYLGMVLYVAFHIIGFWQGIWAHYDELL